MPPQKVYGTVGMGAFNPFDPNRTTATPAPFVPTVPTAEQMGARQNFINNQKPSEPAVISSTTVSDQVIPDAQKKLTELSQKGTTTGSNGQPVYANGAPVPPPAGSKYNAETGQFDPIDTSDTSVAGFYGDGSGNGGDADYQAITAQFAPLKAQLDASTLQTVNAIHSQFDALRAQQQQFNRAAEASRSVALMRGGTTRYAPLDAAGTMLAQTSYGLQQIANLNAQENTAIASANAAQQSGNMKLMTEALNMAEDARKAKQDAAATVLDQINTANQKLNEARLQANRDEQIANLVSAGTTNPAIVLKTLNDAGGNFTANEVDAALKNLTVAGTSSKDISTDLSTFNYIKENFGLPKDIASLPPSDQYFAYLAAVKGAQTTPKKPTSSPTGNPSWEEYLAAAQKASNQSYFMKPEEAQLRAQYDAQYGEKGTAIPFTKTQLQKLEAAGLLNAQRAKQLEYLFPKSGTSNTTDLPAALQ